MLINFSFSNFKSYRDNQQFSMLRAIPAQKHEDYDWPHKEISMVAGLYGGNASGKSAFIDAFKFITDFVIDSFNPNFSLEDALQPFRLDASSKTRPSNFLVDFIGTDDERYRLELSITQEHVTFESLRIYNGGRSSRIYEREYQEETGLYSYCYGRFFTGAKKSYEQMTRPNALMISVLYAANVSLAKPVYEFFRQRVGTYRADLFDWELENIQRELKRGTSSSKAIVRLMKEANLGISLVQTKDLLNEIFEASQDDGDPRGNRYAELTSGLLALSQPELTREERNERASKLAKQPPEPVYQLSFTHTGANGFQETFSEEDESRGTLAVLAFFSLALRLLARRSIGFVDEIDSSLHPNYVEELVALFKDPRTNPYQSQLVFTTHDVSLITRTGADRRILDQDQIWFVEKDVDGSSELYPVTAIPSRWEENFGRNYLHGIYGASPRPNFHEAFVQAEEELKKAQADYTAEKFCGEAK